jgi:hypothetical protein
MPEYIEILSMPVEPKQRIGVGRELWPRHLKNASPEEAIVILTFVNRLYPEVVIPDNVLHKPDTQKSQGRQDD